MPLVEIFVSEARSASDRKKLADAVHQALVQAVSIPEADRFQLVRTLPAADVFIDTAYLGLARTPDFLVVRVTLRRGRSNAIKRALYDAVATNAAAAIGLRREDVMIVLAENDAADWSFGGGLAQYALEN
jgi:4-oxalocrotonate tautomerase